MATGYTHRKQFVIGSNGIPNRGYLLAHGHQVCSDTRKILGERAWDVLNEHQDGKEKHVICVGAGSGTITRLMSYLDGIEAQTVPVVGVRDRAFDIDRIHFMAPVLDDTDVLRHEKSIPQGVVVARLAAHNCVATFCNHVLADCSCTPLASPWEVEHAPATSPEADDPGAALAFYGPNCVRYFFFEHSQYGMRRKEIARIRPGDYCLSMTMEFDLDKATGFVPAVNPEFAWQRESIRSGWDSTVQESTRITMTPLHAGGQTYRHKDVTPFNHSGRWQGANLTFDVELDAGRNRDPHDPTTYFAKRAKYAESLNQLVAAGHRVQAGDQHNYDRMCDPNHMLRDAWDVLGLVHTLPNYRGQRYRFYSEATWVAVGEERAATCPAGGVVAKLYIGVGVSERYAADMGWEAAAAVPGAEHSVRGRAATAVPGIDARGNPIACTTVVLSNFDASLEFELTSAREDARTLIARMDALSGPAEVRKTLANFTGNVTARYKKLNFLQIHEMLTQLVTEQLEATYRSARAYHSTVHSRNDILKEEDFCLSWLGEVSSGYDKSAVTTVARMVHRVFFSGALTVRRREGARH